MGKACATHCRCRGERQHARPLSPHRLAHGPPSCGLEQAAGRAFAWLRRSCPAWCRPGCRTRSWPPSAAAGRLLPRSYAADGERLGPAAARALSAFDSLPWAAEALALSASFDAMALCYRVGPGVPTPVPLSQSGAGAGEPRRRSQYRDLPEYMLRAVQCIGIGLLTLKETRAPCATDYRRQGIPSTSVHVYTFGLASRVSDVAGHWCHVTKATPRRWRQPPRLIVCVDACVDWYHCVLRTPTGQTPRQRTQCVQKRLATSVSFSVWCMGGVRSRARWVRHLSRAAAPCQHKAAAARGDRATGRQRGGQQGMRDCW